MRSGYLICIFLTGLFLLVLKVYSDKSGDLKTLCDPSKGQIKCCISFYLHEWIFKKAKRTVVTRNFMPFDYLIRMF